MTYQREIILEELKRVKCHPTADQLYEMVRTRLPRISLATVYRNLEVMSDAGIIKKLEYAGKQKRFDGNIENHHHIRCVKCGKIDDVAVKTVTEGNQHILDAAGYTDIRQRLDFYGLCPECKRREAEHSQNGESVSIHCACEDVLDGMDSKKNK